MKDAVVFPSKNGLQLLPPAGLLQQIDDINEQEATSFKEKLNVRDGIIESQDNIKEEFICDELVNFSNKIIEESLPIIELINEHDNNIRGRDSDSIIYSQIEI